MEPIAESEIRASFVNCSKGAAKRLSLPADLDGQPWADLDFLGWNDPTYAGRCYLVMPGDDGPIGLALTYQTGGSRRTQMCAICSTTHSAGGVTLMTAQKAGPAGRRGDVVGTYMCADLDCSLYVRRIKSPTLGRSYRDDFDTDERIAQINDRVSGLIDRVRT